MNLANIRSQFPALKEKTFLDAASVSLAPSSAIEAIQKFLEMAKLCPSRSSTENHILMDGMREEARSLAAKLINAKEEEIALIESTTHGLTIAANAIPLERGDRVILCDLEFLEVAIPWWQKQKEIGIKIDMVPNRQGIIRIEDIAKRITHQTRVIAISSVQWTNGFRCDLKALSSLCRRRHIWLVVDAIQQLGAIPVDVQDTPLDFLACGGHKWLNSPFGTGILYIRHEAMSKLRSPIAGYMSLETPEQGWGEYFQTPSITPIRDYKFVHQARVYENGGSANYMGAIGLGESLKMIHELGPGHIADHIFKLTNYLIKGLRMLGVEIITPIEPKYRSGIVTFSIGSQKQNLDLMNYLLDHKVLVSLRYTSFVGGVRVSCHFYNSLADFDRLLDLVDRSLKRRK